MEFGKLPFVKAIKDKIVKKNKKKMMKDKEKKESEKSENEKRFPTLMEAIKENNRRVRAKRK